MNISEVYMEDVFLTAVYLTATFVTAVCFPAVYLTKVTFLDMDQRSISCVCMSVCRPIEEMLKKKGK